MTVYYNYKRPTLEESMKRFRENYDESGWPLPRPCKELKQRIAEWELKFSTVTPEEQQMMIGEPQELYQ